MPETVSHRPSTLARRTGLAYLGIILSGVVAEFAVRGTLVVADDPVATARNIAGSPGLFRAGIGADLVMVVLDVYVAVGLFRLLRTVDRRLAATATALRLVQAAVLVGNLLFLLRALGFAQDAADAGGVTVQGPAGRALDAVELHALGYDVGLIAFGLCCVALGRLLWVSGAVSRVLAVGMAVTGGVYLAGSLAALLAPSLLAVVDPFYLVAFVVELAFAVRLVVRGLDPVPVRTGAPVAVAA